MKLFLRCFIVLIIFSSSSIANEVKVFEFTDKELSELSVRKVRGADNKTIYSVGSNNNGNYLKAVADNAGSGLGKEIKIDLNKTPFINITWKIEQDLSGINEKTKKGHDFAARVFAAQLGTEHIEMLFTPEMAFEAIEKVIYYSETYEPELVRSCISNYFLAQKTSEYVKVVLTGEGTN